GLRQFGVSCTLKDRAGFRIGIEKINVFWGERKLLFRLADILNSECVENEYRGLGGRLHRAAERQETERLATVGCREDLPNLEKAEQAHERPRQDQVFEEILGCVGEGDTRRERDTGPPRGIRQLPAKFCEHGIGVDVSPSGQGKPASVTHEAAGSGSRAECLDKLQV